jgi:hypothetical protein
VSLCGIFRCALLRMQFNINFRVGSTAMHLASILGRRKCLTPLLQCTNSHNGNTIIFVICCNQFIAGPMSCLDGANPFIQNDSGQVNTSLASRNSDKHAKRHLKLFFYFFIFPSRPLLKWAQTHIYQLCST